MTTMNRLSILFAMVSVLLLSCKKFLDVDPPSSKILSEVVYTSDAMANSALIGIYMDMYSGKGYFAGGGANSLSSLAGLSADELHNNLQTDPAIISFETNSLLANNERVNALWTSMYKAIYQANAVLEGLDVSKGVTPALKDQLRGEALFIRAFCHFYLVNIFGDVPIIKTTDYRITAKVSRNSQADVYKQVEDDLLEANILLPENYVNAKRIRPVKAVATALLARLYLYIGNWSKAEECATKIISNENVYRLEDDLNKVFLGSSREAIWQLKPVDNLSFTQEGGYFLSAIMGPENNVLSEALVNSYQSIDQRKVNWITNRGSLYLPYKYKLYQITGQSSTEYSIIFRLAELYFIRAEARAKKGVYTGNNSAESDINVIRHRAGLPDLKIGSENEALLIIENERKFELFTEWGHRWLDLKRWNRTIAILTPMKSGFSDNDVLYPIPQEEMNKNPFLAPQNKGY